MSVSSIISTIKARIASGKPYIAGAVIGAIATLVIEFNAGWVVSAGSVEQQVADARMTAVATICAHQASAQWTADGNEMAALEGWSNKARDELAQRFTPMVEDLSADRITNACSRMLRPA